MIETICMLASAKYCVKFYQLGIIPSFSGVINTSSCRIIKMSISSEMEQNSFTFDLSVGRLKEGHIGCLTHITRVHIPLLSFLLFSLLSHTHIHMHTALEAKFGFCSNVVLQHAINFSKFVLLIILKKIRGQKGCKMSVE